MHLIATDEAGYGPKLGPLVIAATRWRIPDGVPSRDTEQLAELFAPLRQTRAINGVNVVVDDSKAVFKPRSHGADGGNLGALELAVQAGYRWSGHADFSRLVRTIVADDFHSIAKTPWLANVETPSAPTATPDAASIDELTGAWSQTGLGLTAIKARAITASDFNGYVTRGMNKSDILSSVTLELVRDLIVGALDGVDAITVFCDRHGGRRYYAAALQAVFDHSLIRVISESKTESAYVVPFRNREFTIRFTVKGDRFTPVAFSSLVAKYLRERLMETLNSYFADHHQGSSPLRSTAGYPVDADRFLDDVAATIRRLDIQSSDLIRCR